MDEVRRAYGAMSAPYIERFGITDQMHPDDLELIDRHLVGLRGTVLDVGCGPGHLTAHLRDQGADALGLEIVPEFLRHAVVAHPQGRYLGASLLQIPVADGSVAGVLAWYSLIHLPPREIDAALAELRRVLRPGGVLVVGFFDGGESTSGLNGDGADGAAEPFDHKVVTAYRWTVDGLAARLHRAGFTEVARDRRAGDAVAGHRPHAALVVVAT